MHTCVWPPIINNKKSSQIFKWATLSAERREMHHKTLWPKWVYLVVFVVIWEKTNSIWPLKTSLSEDDVSMFGGGHLWVQFIQQRRVFLKERERECTLISGRTSLWKTQARQFPSSPRTIRLHYTKEKGEKKRERPVVKWKRSEFKQLAYKQKQKQNTDNNKNNKT